MSPKYFLVQQFINSVAKRVKVEPVNTTGNFLFISSLISISSTFSLAPTRQMHSIDGCSEEAFKTAQAIAKGPELEPSRAALIAQIADLEADIRNVDFRLQNFFHQRTVIANIRDSSVARLAVLNKTA